MKRAEQDETVSVEKPALWTGATLFAEVNGLDAAAVERGWRYNELKLAPNVADEWEREAVRLNVRCAVLGWLWPERERA